jgi:riboflavin transporter FmnP
MLYIVRLLARNNDVIMNTRAIAATIVFAAITIVLNPAFMGLAIPAPFFPYVIYYLWEIPIVAAAFLIGPKHGISIAFVNMLVLLATSQGFAPQQPFYQSAAAICMVIGIYLAIKIVVRKAPQQEAIPKRKLLIFSTALGILFRVGIMTLLAYALFRYPVIGFSLPEPVILTIIPMIALYDATLPLYTIPIGYLIAITVRKNLKIGNKI